MQLPPLASRLGGILLLAGLTALAAGCGSPGLKDGPPKRPSGGLSPTEVTPRPEPLSRYGNGPEYEVLGKRYTVMESSDGFRERGVASWYGTKFHGRLTSNREVYDMYAMTAAHKTLPLPTWVEVRNLRNNKSIVVRVNDRGPFVHNRIIDLSYGAAMQLDMIEDGTSLVEIRAIEFDAGGDRPVRTIMPTEPPDDAADRRTGNDIFVQVGAFGDRENAERRRAFLLQNDIGDVRIEPDASRTPTLYRVQIGPVADVFAYDRIVDKLATLGIDDPWLVTR